MITRTATAAIALALLAGSLALPNLAPADDLVGTPEFSALQSSLMAHEGFLGLAPALDDSNILHAAFSGAAPSDSFAALVPAGWSLKLHPDQAIERLRLEVGSVTDIDDLTQRQRDSVPPIPEDAVGIGPGSPILQTIPGEGTYICTANYVFESGGKVYLGSAGHCFLPADKKATHGSGADYNANNVVVEVCYDWCYFGGQLQGFLGDMATLGTVAYARQTGTGGDIGNDFGVVEIPSNLHHLVRAEMPMWEGPTGADGNEGIGSPVVHYGNGIDAGTVFASKGRAGTSLGDGDSKSWQANIMINGGDSGSAINHGWIAAGSDVLEGTDALGIITHGLVTGGIPLGWGTTIEQAITMAGQANLNLDLLLEGETLGDSGPPPVLTKVHVSAIDTAAGHTSNGGHFLDTTVTVVDDQGAAVAGVLVSLDVDAAGRALGGSGTTDALGKVTINVQHKKAGHGTWDSCVTGLSGTGLQYDSAANVETCQAHTVS